MAPLFEKIQAMDAAEKAHMRQFNDPSFHFVPRQKMMQIEVRVSSSPGHTSIGNKKPGLFPNMLRMKIDGKGVFPNVGNSLPTPHGGQGGVG